MEKVTLKAKSETYGGYVRGYRFVNGEAKDVPLEEAKVMEEAFGVSIVQPEQPKEEKPKPKRSPRKKKGE